MSSELKTKGEEWRDRIFKMILFFAILGTIVLGIGGYFLSKTLNDALKQDLPGATTTTTSTSTGTSTTTTH